MGTHSYLTTITGRNFIRKQNSKVYIQCRFNTEVLTTNPTSHEAKPIWDTELAWEVESKVFSTSTFRVFHFNFPVFKALHYLKSQRATLKLMVHSIDGHNRRDTLGYVVLDLRAATQKADSVDKWYPLINSKVGGAFRPEIKLSFCLSLPSDRIPKEPVDYKSSRIKERVPRSIAGSREVYIKNHQVGFHPFLILRIFHPTLFYQMVTTKLKMDNLGGAWQLLSPLQKTWICFYLLPNQVPNFTFSCSFWRQSSRLTNFLICQILGFQRSHSWFTLWLPRVT